MGGVRSPDAESQAGTRLNVLIAYLNCVTKRSVERREGPDCRLGP